MEALLPGRVRRRGGQWSDHRRLIDGVLWRTRTGSPWRDLPAVYGKWKTVYNRHRRWSGDGTWEQVLDRLRTGADQQDDGGQWLLGVDATVIRAHHHAAGAPKTPPKDVPAERLTPTVLEVVGPPAGGTGGWIESQESGANRRIAG